MIGKLDRKEFKIKKGAFKRNFRQENGYDDKGSWRKCTICVTKCKHDGENCSCSASSHLVRDCFFNRDNSKEGKESKRRKKDDQDPGLDADKVVFTEEFGDMHSYQTQLYNTISGKTSTTLVLEHYNKTSSMESYVWDVRTCLASDIEVIALKDGKIRGFVDSASPGNIMEKFWYTNLLKKAPSHIAKFINVQESERIFKFGGGELRKSLGYIKFPCKLGDKKGNTVTMTAEIVDAKIPLLLGAEALDRVLWGTSRRSR